jgi:proline iminopeptidase
MRVLVNGVHLYFDVDGSALRAHGDDMRELPTLLLLHGGPGVDHSLYKPAFSALTDVAQVVYLDHRGNGRSERAAPDSWTLAQWGDDVAAFCDALGIVRPIVYGASFGGMVAIAYAVRHPAHPGGLVLVSTSAQGFSHADAKVAMFSRLGGEAAGALARRRFIDGDTSADVLRSWLEVALPLYQRTPLDPAVPKRFVLNREVTAWFNRPGGDARTFDYLADLARLRCPALVLGGTLDPMVPIECQRDIAGAVPPHLLTYREFEGCGHGVVPDAPDEALALIRAFIRAREHGAAVLDEAR